MKTMKICLLAVSMMTSVFSAADNTKFDDWKARLPRPIYDEKPELVELYEKAWEIAHTRIDNLPGIPVPRYMDEGHRSDWIWIWDTCFMVHYTKYASFEFPGIESLGNFYGLMFPEGDFELPKVIGNRWSCGPTGTDDPWEGKLLDFKLALPDNPPLFAWTEYRHALQTGDSARLKAVYSEKRYLQRWFEMFESFSPKDQSRKGVLAVPALCREGDLGYHWDGGRSGMDNTPRGRVGEKDLGPKSPGDCPNNPDLLWVDAYSQQALAALYISRIAELLGDIEGAAEWRAKYDAKKAKINELYWDEEDGFYYDMLASDRSKCKVPTIASDWPLLAEVPSPRQRQRLLAKLTDANWFGGDIPLPSLARKDADFWPTGGYWRGGVWMPTTYMTIKGLDRFGEFALARDLAKKIVFDMYETYRQVEPHTVWECYSPTEPKPATYAKSKGWVRDNFCGWSALGPISLFIEDMIGIKEANAFLNELTCNFADAIKGRVGVENYRFGKVTCSIVATTEKIEVESDAAFLLRANGRDYAVRPGKNVFDRGAKETIVIMPCHPDDLISALGLCLKAHDRFDIHVVDFTHGERGLGPKGLADGSTKKIRMAEEQSVCDAAGVRKLHWLDEIDGEAYASRETCHKLAEILKDVNPRAIFGHSPSDIHTDHVMAGAAMLRAVFLSGLKPEVYFFGQEYQTKGFVGDCVLDISDVFERKYELVRKYRCQYRDGGIERRHRAADTFYGMGTQMLAFGKAESFKSLYPRTQGERRIFDEIDPIPSLLGERKFQGARDELPRPARPCPVVWPDRQKAKRDEITASGGSFDIVFIGDSITHGWENPKTGLPVAKEGLSDFKVLNLGYSGNRVEHMIWRMENGELDGYTAKLFVVLAGTNNLGKDAPENIAEGLRHLLARIRNHHPEAKILLLSVFPRGENPSDGMRIAAEKVNTFIRDISTVDCVRRLDIWDDFLDKDGKASRETQYDFLHLTTAGYQIWLRRVLPVFREICWGRSGGSGD